MTKTQTSPGAGRLDLTISRLIDAPRELVWQAWTKPEHIKQWWAPKPVQVVECKIDLRPGGEFTTLMRDPDGNDYPGTGIFLEVHENERIVFTDALEPGYRPAKEPFMTAIITFEAQPGGKTRYTAVALHKDEADREKHEDMGFHDGWGTVLEQLAAFAESIEERS